MEKIVEFEIIESFNSNSVRNVAKNKIDEWQNMGLDVKVDYQLAKSQNGTIFSVMLIGKEQQLYSPRNLKGSLYYVGQKVLIRKDLREGESIK